MFTSAATSFDPANKKRPIDDDDDTNAAASTTGRGGSSSSSSAEGNTTGSYREGYGEGRGHERDGGRLGKAPRPPMVPPPMLPPPQRALSPNDGDDATAREKAGASPVQVLPTHQSTNQSNNPSILASPSLTLTLTPT